LEACCLDNTTTSDKEEWMIAEAVGALDVMMGRGYEVQIHPGNVRCRKIIAERHEVYDKVLIYEKTAIADTIVRLIKESGGRFLQDGWAWLEVG
jgi:hypothetical protein